MKKRFKNHSLIEEMKLMREERERKYHQLLAYTRGEDIDKDPGEDTDKESIDHPPNTPSKPSGTSSGEVGVSYTYSTSATDPDGDQIKYIFDWGDGNTSETGFVSSGTTASEPHSWSIPGSYSVRTQAVDSNGDSSARSNAKSITILPIRYTLSTEASPLEGGNISPSSGTYDSGTQVTLNATPSPNYEFEYWSGDASRSVSE